MQINYKNQLNFSSISDVPPVMQGDVGIGRLPDLLMIPMKLSFYPVDLSSSNSYIARICQAIKVAVPSVEIQAFSNKKILSFSDSSKVCWLNWYENLGNKTITHVFKNFMLKFVVFLCMKCAHKRVILVLHNKRPHEVYGKALVYWFMQFLLRHSDHIIVLCEDSYPVVNRLAKKDVSNKVHKILHPSYICVPKQYHYAPNAPFTILFAGLLRPYKNVELLLSIAEKHPELQFLISGQPLDKSYADFLVNRVSYLANVNLELKYNTDEEFDQLMDKSSILVLPYHLDSTLNSGVAMYAFSKGINVVMPIIGTVTELENRNCVFGYSYADESEHCAKLEEMIMKAFTLYQNKFEEFVQRAEKIREEVLRRCSINAISEQIKSSGILDLESK